MRRRPYLEIGLFINVTMLITTVCAYKMCCFAITIVSPKLNQVQVTTILTYHIVQILRCVGPYYFFSAIAIKFDMI